MEPQEGHDVARTAAIASLIAFAEHAAAALNEDDRVRIIWLTGSLATGTADTSSDIDLRVAVSPEHFTHIEEWWEELVEGISPTVWKRRWPSPPDEAITSAITTDYIRFDVVVQSTADTRTRTYEAARLLVDKDKVADRITLTAPTQSQPLAHLSYVVEEFIRIVGMLPIVVGRDDIPIGMEGQMACHSLFISLLMMEKGMNRMAMGKRHVTMFLDDEQRTVLTSIPVLAPTVDSVVKGILAYARLFLPRARRLMEANGFAYPEVFEVATLRHLKDTLGVEI